MQVFHPKVSIQFLSFFYFTKLAVFENGSFEKETGVFLLNSH